MRNRSNILDLLRIFSAFWVMSYHWSGFSGFIKSLKYSLPSDFIPQHLVPLTSRGWLGVDIFFILSGSVIAKSLIETTPRKFMIARFNRLFPSYFVASVFALILLKFTIQSFNAPHFLLSMTSLQFFVGGATIIGTAWTLQYEIIFYFLVFILIYFLKSRNLSMTPDWLFKFLNFWLLGLVLAPSINSHLLTFFVMTNFGPYFILGACLSQIIDKKSLKKYVVSTFISFVLSGRELIYRIDGYSMHHKHVVKESIFLSIVVAVVVSANYKQVFSRNLFVTKIIRRLSLMTYPIYLLHEVIGLSVITLLIHAGMGHFISYIIVFVFIMFLSWLLTRYLEPKFNSIIRRYYLD